VTDEPEWYLCFAAVRSRSRRHDPKWRDQLRAALADEAWSNCLDPTGELRDYGGRPIGRYQLFDVREVQARWGSAAWFTIDPPCPFVGPVSGFFNWESWTDAKTGRDFARDLLWATRGYLARTDQTDRFEGFVEETFPLGDAARKGGFHDGDFFLRDDPVYGQYVRDTIVAAVEALGLRPELFNGGTSHNPHRIDDFVARKTLSHAACWQKFRDHEHLPLRLWGFNLTGVASPALARFLEPIP
jgi:hypothetical protein